MSDRGAAFHLDLMWSAGLARKAIEPELFALLDAIRQTGKLTNAAARVGLPYRQAWGLLMKWSGIIGQPLVAKEQGRGTNLTPLGERLLWLRERIEARLSPHLESAVSEVEQQIGFLLDAPQPLISLYASHDLALVELRDFLRARPGPKLDIRFVGSLDSVVALCQGRSEMAGFHIPDGDIRSEVVAIYQPWLKPRVERLIHFVRRSQGLIVTPDNPKGIGSLADIVPRKARFINRQRGSGTRLAVDKILKDQGIDKSEIIGYSSEEFTHLAVAAAVASGMADVGVGIEAAAMKLRMRFIPLFTETYYLLVKKEALEQKMIGELIAVLKSDTFRAMVGALPGYDASEAGAIKLIKDAV